MLFMLPHLFFHNLYAAIRLYICIFVFVIAIQKNIKQRIDISNSLICIPAWCIQIWDIYDIHARKTTGIISTSSCWAMWLEILAASTGFGMRLWVAKTHAYSIIPWSLVRDGHRRLSQSVSMGMLSPAFAGDEQVSNHLIVIAGCAYWAQDQHCCWNNTFLDCSLRTERDKRCHKLG